MKNIFRLLLLFAASLSSAYATTPVGYVAVTGTHLQSSTGTLVANATISFAPVNNNGQALSYQVNGNGQSTNQPVTALVTAGAFTIQLADSTLTNPVNVCYNVTVTDNLTNKSILGGGYSCVQPAGSGVAVTGGGAWCTAAGGGSGGACTFDLYVPNLAALVVTQISGATGGGTAPTVSSCSVGFN